MLNTLSNAQGSMRLPPTVVFSDSRTDASHMAAELELNHCRDTTRALAEHYLRNPEGELGAKLDFIRLAPDMDEFDCEAHPFWKANNWA